MDKIEKYFKIAELKFESPHHLEKAWNEAIDLFIWHNKHFIEYLDE